MTFSRRIPQDLSPNPLAASVAALLARGGEVHDLTESNPTRVGLPYPRDEILAALADPEVLSYAPDPRGRHEAREAVAARSLALGVRTSPDDVVLTASTSEAYSWLFKVLCDPGDRVLVPRPGYPLLDLLARVEGVDLVPYPLRYDGTWHLDLPALRAVAADPRTRAVVVVNPNNPTGSFLKRDELAALESLAAGRDLAIVSDEVFAEYAWGDDPDRVTTVAGERGALAFSLGGLSKTAGLPQLKLGWIVASGPGPAKEEALRRLELVADTFLSVGAPVQVAAPRLLELTAPVRDAIASRVRRNRSALEAALAGAPGAATLRGEGGWYAVVRVPAVGAEDDLVTTLLRDDRVHVHPGWFFDFPGGVHLVVSLLPCPDRFAEAASRLAARLAEWIAGGGR
ncbi:pyridoxal phosphate-dependent aminotransferase [Myxococcota bacterium]|nr:pyridoxal phosphate-dependent aminotransferase [Myxococcota bacterium]